MTWLDVVENPKAIKEIFDVPPLLESVEIVSIEIDRDGPTAKIHIAVDDPPSRAPRRKHLSGANAVTLTLQLFGIDNLAMKGWSTENRASVELQKEDAGSIDVRVSGTTMQCGCRCRGVRIEHITAYTRAK